MASEHGVQSSIDAMRTFGASGYTTALGLEADVRDALGGLAYSGTPDVTRTIVASQLGWPDPHRTMNESQKLSSWSLWG